MKREQWIVAKTVENAIKVLNSGFCSDGKDEQEWSEEDFNEVREYISKNCSKTMIEDVFIFLNPIFKEKETLPPPPPAPENVVIKEGQTKPKNKDKKMTLEINNLRELLEAINKGDLDESKLRLVIDKEYIICEYEDEGYWDIKHEDWLSLLFPKATIIKN